MSNKQNIHTHTIISGNPDTHTNTKKEARIGSNDTQLLIINAKYKFIIYHFHFASISFNDNNLENWCGKLDEKLLECKEEHSCLLPLPLFLNFM